MPIHLPHPAGGGDGAGDEGIKIRAFLENTGIPFIDAKGHKFAFDGFQMIITHERRYLDLIERILSKLDEESSKQVEIEAKFLRCKKEHWMKLVLIGNIHGEMHLWLLIQIQAMPQFDSKGIA